MERCSARTGRVAPAGFFEFESAGLRCLAQATRYPRMSAALQGAR